MPIGCSPNGRNINDGCGSTAPDLLQLTVPGVRANVGLALDGDGDRLVMVDHLGRIVDGDQLLYVIARALKDAGTLRGPVVGTVMSNLGLELALRAAGIDFQRAAVGDRYVLAMLRETRRHPRRGDLRAHPVPGQDHHRRRPGERAAGAGRHEADAAGRWPSSPPAMRKFPQVLLNVKVARRFDPRGVSRRCRRRWRASRSAWAGRGAWCCAPPAPSR